MIEKQQSITQNKNLQIGCLFSISSVSQVCLNNMQFHFTLHFINFEDFKTFGNSKITYDLILIDIKHLEWIESYNKRELWNNIHLPLLLMLQEKETVPVKMLMHPIIDKTIINCTSEINFSDKIGEVYRSIIKKKHKETNTIVRPTNDNKLQHMFLSKLNHTIQSNMETGHFTLTDLAAYLNMSSVSLRKKIKRITGKTAVRYILEHRLIIAKNLLTNKGFTVQDTALKTGFLSNSYFTKSFKKKFGTVPSRYSEYALSK